MTQGQTKTLGNEFLFEGSPQLSLFENDGDHWYDRDDFIAKHTITQLPADLTLDFKAASGNAVPAHYELNVSIVNASLIFSPRSLTFTSRSSSPSVTKSITITSTHANPVVVTIEDATVDTTPSTIQPPIFGGTPRGTFSNNSGQVTVPSNGSIQVGITFIGESGLGSINGNLRIRWDSEQVNIPLLGTLVQEAHV